MLAAVASLEGLSRGWVPGILSCGYPGRTESGGCDTELCCPPGPGAAQERHTKVPRTGNSERRTCLWAPGDFPCTPTMPGYFIMIIQSFPSNKNTILPSEHILLMLGCDLTNVYGKEVQSPPSSHFAFLVAKKFPSRLLQEGHQDYPSTTLPFLTPFSNNYSVYTVYKIRF